MTETTDRVGIEAGAPASSNATPSSPAAGTATNERRLTRLSGLHSGLIVAAGVMVVLLVFILENAHSVSVRFLGADVRLPLAVALLLAAVGGALLVGTIGAARIAQLRRGAKREAQRVD